MSRFSTAALLEECLHVFLMDSTQYFVLSGESSIGTIAFLDALKAHETFIHTQAVHISLEEKEDLEKILKKTLQNKKEVYFLEPNNTLSFDEICTIIDEHKIDAKIIIINDTPIEDTRVTNFSLPSIGFRDFCQERAMPIQIGSVLQGTADIEGINTLFEQYISQGAFLENNEEPERIFERFSQKIAVMNKKLFKKEEKIFLEFIRTLALTVGNLYKGDQIANLMGISRRKVHKYTELLLRHKVITGIGPFVTNTQTELSRHVKIYFTDLSFYVGALEGSYGMGAGRLGVIENFVYLEMARKLDTTHELRFWRKKSGTEITFVLIQKDSGTLVPIEVTTRPNFFISKAMKSFYESYGPTIEYGMFLNEKTVKNTQFDEKKFLVLPYPII